MGWGRVLEQTMRRYRVLLEVVQVASVKRSFCSLTTPGMDARPCKNPISTLNVALANVCSPVGFVKMFCVECGSQFYRCPGAETDLQDTGWSLSFGGMIQAAKILRMPPTTRPPRDASQELTTGDLLALAHETCCVLSR